jgi:LL-diaminopimelate aminotransferase
MLDNSYLFSLVNKKANDYISNNPGVDLINLGIGDVIFPLAQDVVNAIKDSADEMKYSESFKGYGPETGYDFLKQTILNNEYANLNINMSEIFISDGIGTDIGNIGDIFLNFNDNVVAAITNPTYPEYLETNIINGYEVVLLSCKPENNFIPDLSRYQDKKIDLIYICNPNNPTGTALNKIDLQQIINYAYKNNSVILYDAAYNKFITSDDIPKSIYEIEGAKETCIEFCSFSKSAGFTGLRCGYTIVPNELIARDSNVSLNKLWYRRQSVKTNGVSYITQRAAAAVYSPESKKTYSDNINYYLENSKIIYNGLKDIGCKVYGGFNSPYIWMKIPYDCSCWEWFDICLTKMGIIVIPGLGFGSEGAQYCRWSSFAQRNDVEKAIEMIKSKI